MKYYILLLCLVCMLGSVSAQSSGEKLIIKESDDVDLSLYERIDSFSIKRRFFKKSYDQLIKQALDSVDHYEGNCLKVTYYDKSEAVDITGWKMPDELRATIYSVSDIERDEIEEEIISYRSLQDSLISSRSTSKDVEIAFGVQFHQFDLANNEGYIFSSKDDFAGILNLFIRFDKVWNYKRNQNLKFRLGVGAAREYLSFYPITTLRESGIAPIDTVRIGEVGNWEYQLLLPIEVSYEWPNLFKPGYGIRLFLGVENRIRIHRVATDVSLVANYDFENNIGAFLEDPELEELAIARYENFISPYSLQGNFGVAILSPEIVTGGIRFIHILSPSLKGQRFNSQFGLMFFLNVPLFNLH